VPTVADPVAQALFHKPNFRWSSSPDEMTMFQTVGNDSVFSILPDPSAVGTQLLLRLEITDDDTDRSAKEFAGCMGDTCSTSDGCFQRVTWTVKFNR
jgi:hypothetical protein